jgi:hypothetical protein
VISNKDMRDFAEYLVRLCESELTAGNGAPVSGGGVRLLKPAEAIRKRALLDVSKFWKT